MQSTTHCIGPDWQADEELRPPIGARSVAWMGWMCVPDCIESLRGPDQVGSIRPGTRAGALPGPLGIATLAAPTAGIAVPKERARLYKSFIRSPPLLRIF
jgi:hypothetical protein